MSAMQPSDLTPQSFHAYPSEARALVIQHIDLIRQLPLILLALMLREAISYDWRFPIERRELESQFSYLESLSKSQLSEVMREFAMARVGQELAELDWVNNPQLFGERLSAYLWSTHQMDAFRAAADRYASSWRASQPEDRALQPRLAIVVLGQGVSKIEYPLFRKLRSKGVYFSSVSSTDGLQTLLSAVSERASKNPIAYGHWYIDGGLGEATVSQVTAVSYAALADARSRLLSRMQRVIQSGSAGPEELRTELAQMKPQEIGLSTDRSAAALSYFQMSLLTEGSGTQIFSTTFAQWAAREALRRAQPSTLLVRFAPRQRQEPMNELLSNTKRSPSLDPEGSLVDADMAAYYTWINQQRLSGADRSAFLVWFEGHDQALAIGPSMPGGTVSTEPTTLSKMLTWLG